MRLALPQLGLNSFSKVGTTIDTDHYIVDYECRALGGCDSIAVNGCNCGLGYAEEALHNRFYFVLIRNATITCEALKLLDIGTCRKCLARSTKNDGASGIVGG